MSVSPRSNRRARDGGGLGDLEAVEDTRGLLSFWVALQPDVGVDGVGAAGGGARGRR
jgi:hypothetical protein